MRSTMLTLILVSCLLSLATSAQVYESEDAEGNPSFSGESTPGSREVEIGSTNLAQPVEQGSSGAATQSSPLQSVEKTPGAESEGGPVIIVNQPTEPELNEGRRVILDSDEYDRGMAEDPRVNAVPEADVETDLVDDEGNRLVDPKKDLPDEGIRVIHKRSARGRI